MNPLDVIYESLDNPQGLAELPAQLASLVSARSNTIQVLSSKGDLRDMAVTYFTPEMSQFYTETEMWRHDIWRLAAERPSANNSAVIVDEAVPLERLERSVFYNEFLRPFGDNTAHCMGSVLRLDDGGSVAIGWHRPIGAEPFSMIEVKTVEPLLRHLKRVFNIRNALESVGQRAALTEAALDADANAVFLLNGSGEVLFMNAAAQAFLERAAGLTLVPGGLRAVNPEVNAALVGTIAAACARTGDFGRAIPLLRGDGSAYSMIISPLQVREATRALLVISDPQRRSRFLRRQLADLFQLTPAEAFTAEGLSRGLSPMEVAALRQVSLATVRTHIRHLFAKMGVRNVPELVAVAVTLPG